MRSYRGAQRFVESHPSSRRAGFTYANPESRSDAKSSKPDERDTQQMTPSASTQAEFLEGLRDIHRRAERVQRSIRRLRKERRRNPDRDSRLAATTRGASPANPRARPQQTQRFEYE